METFERTVQSLGRPIWTHTLCGSPEPAIRAARWRHPSAEVLIPEADSIRIVLNLAHGPVVRHIEGDKVVEVRSSPGNISVLRSGVYSRTTISGHADVLQIFISPQMLSHTESSPNTHVDSAALHSQLRRAVLRMLAGGEAGRDASSELLGAELQGLVHKLLSPPLERGNWSNLKRSGSFPILRAEETLARVGKRPDEVVLQAIASAVGWSIPHLIRSFRKERNTTPHQYLITKRLERAMGMLLNSSYTVANIADIAGFTTSAHFVATFHRHFGLTPGAYRRALCGVQVRRGSFLDIAR